MDVELQLEIFRHEVIQYAERGQMMLDAYNLKMELYRLRVEQIAKAMESA